MLGRLAWPALGAFAIGTESLVIAGILPALSADLRISLAQAGQLVTVFAITYAIVSPLLAVLTAGRRKEWILRAAMAGFALGNVAAACAPSFGWLMLARMLLASLAGLFMATAGAYAAGAVPAAQRGRAMAFVYMGLTVATVIGVPIGTMVGSVVSWRATFLLVGALAAVACIGLCLPRELQPLHPAPTLAERLAIARRPEVLLALCTTVAALAGAFTVYTYLSPLLKQVGGLGDGGVAAVLMMFGAAGAAGSLLGGTLADRLGPMAVLRASVIGLVILFGAISVAALWVGPGWNLALLLVAIAGWGVVGWSFPPAQQLNLVQRAPGHAPVVLSLNASATYVGISLGAALGSVAVAHGAVADVGWVAAGCAAVAWALVTLAARGSAAKGLRAARGGAA